MTTVASRLAWIVTRYRVPLIALVLTLGALAAAMLPRVEGEFSPQALFASHPEEEAFAQRFVERFGSAENTLVLVLSADDLFTPETLAWMRSIGDHAADLDGVERVQSIVHSPLPRAEGDGVVSLSPLLQGPDVTAEDAERLRAVTADLRTVRGTLLSTDGRMALIAVVFDRHQRQVAEIQPLVHTIHALLDEHPPPAGVSTFFGGLPHIRVHVVGRLIGDQFVLIPLAALVNLLFLALAFRWVPGIVLPLASVGLGTVLLVGGMGFANEPFNIINNVLPTLVIVIGISDSIHLLNRYREEIHGGQRPERAIRTTIRTMAVACLFTSLTTAIGFGSLLVSHTSLLQRFGATAAIGVLIVYIVTILFLPATLTFFNPPRYLPRRGHDGHIERVALSAHAIALRAPRTVLLVSAALLVAAAALGSRVIIDSSLLELFDKDDPMHVQTLLLEEKLGGVLSFDISLQADTPGTFEDPEILQRVEALADWVAAKDGVLGVRMWTDLLRDMRVAWTGNPDLRDAPFRSRAEVAQLAFLMEDGNEDPSGAWISPDRSWMRLNVRSADFGSRAMLDAAIEFEAHYQQQFPTDNISMRLSGDGYLGSLGLDLLIRDLLSSLGAALAIIFLVLILLFRSVRLGLLAFPPNVIPLIVTLGYMGARGIPLNSTTLIIFSVSLGLAVDNTIHVVSRYREERLAGRTRDEALEAVARGTGRAVLVASLLLLCGLAVVLFSSFVPIRLFAELTALTILSCVAADLLVLPALLHLFDRDGEADARLAAPGVPNPPSASSAPHHDSD